MMHTARATPAGARSIAAQHTRAEIQQLRPQTHCKQHRCNHNGCSLIATSMQLRLYHCYNCNVVHTALATIATATVTTDANIAPATATILQVQPQLQPHCCADIATATTTAPATTMQSLQLQTQSQLKCKHMQTRMDTMQTQVQTQVQTHVQARCQVGALERQAKCMQMHAGATVGVVIPITHSLSTKATQLPSSPC